MIFTTEAAGPHWHEPVVLQGSGLTLTPLRLDDAADYLAALGPPAEANEVLAHLTFHPPDDLAATTTIIADALDDPDRIAYAQRLTSTGELVGTTSSRSGRRSGSASAHGSVAGIDGARGRRRLPT